MIVEAKRAWIARLWHFARVILSRENDGEPGARSAMSAERRRQITQFEAFYWQYEHQIILYLRRMLGDEQAAFDLSQETFLRA